MAHGKAQGRNGEQPPVVNLAWMNYAGGMDGRAQGNSCCAGIILAGLAALCAIAAGASAAGAPAAQPTKGNMQLTSTAFESGKPIPTKYACEGVDVSPALSWSQAPSNTKSFVLIVDDPDAPSGTWVHWVIYGLPGTATGVAENAPPQGARQGVNDFHRLGYRGPCPPAGKAHRYFFKLYALDTELGLKPGATKNEVERAMENHVVGQAELMGTYQRR